MPEVDIDFSKVPDRPEGFDPVPADDYVLKLVKHDVKPITSGGKGVSLQFDIVEGPYKGRKLFGWMNLWSTAPKGEGKTYSAREFAEMELKSLVYACGLRTIKALAELYNIPVVATVKLQAKRNAPNEMENVIRAYKRHERDAMPKQTKHSEAPW